MYNPLRALVGRLGASWLLELHPGIVTSSLEALGDSAAGPAATSFVEEFLRRLHIEFHASSESLACPPRGPACLTTMLLHSLAIHSCWDFVLCSALS